MIVPTNEVRKILEEMVVGGELTQGGEMPRHGEMRTIFGLRRMQCAKVLWELTINNEVTRIDKRHFYGAAPANTRSKEQIHFILLRMIATGQVAEGEEFARSLVIRTAFNTSAAIVQDVRKQLVTEGLISDKHKCKQVEKGAQQKAAQALESFQFTLTALESQVDECFELIQTAPTVAAAHKEIKSWRSKNRHKEEALFLCGQLQQKFGLESLGSAPSANESLTLAQLLEQAGACREWLRRYHSVREDDGLLVAIASL